MPGDGPRGADGSCCSVRYLSTKPAMPRSLSHSATLTPSLSNPSTRSAPPGAITAAAPVAIAASGRNTVSVGSLTFVMTRSPEGDLVIDSGIDQCSEPGALPGQRRSSVWARAGVTAHSATAAQQTSGVQRAFSLLASRRRAQRRDRRTRRSRPNHRHHAAVVAVDLEVLEVEAALAHELRQRPAARERRRGAGSFGHEDRQTRGYDRTDTSPCLRRAPTSARPRASARDSAPRGATRHRCPSSVRRETFATDRRRIPR